MNRLALMVRFHRKKAELTQLQLAKLSGVGKTSVFDIEKGKSSVQLATLLAVLNVLNIQMSFKGPIMYQFEKHEKS